MNDPNTRPSDLRPLPDIGPAASRLVGDLCARLAPGSRVVVDRIADQLADGGVVETDATLIDLLRASVEANVNAILHLLTHDIPIEAQRAPTAAVEYAHRLAQRGAPIEGLVRAYHVGQDVLLEGLFDEVAATGVEAEVAFEAMRYIVRVVHRYADWIAEALRVEYAAEQRRWSVTAGLHHARRLRQVLVGVDPDPAQFRAETGYLLDQCHLAVVVWPVQEPSGAGAVDHMVETMQRLVRMLGDHLGVAHPALFTAVDPNLGWGWLPRGSDCDPLPTSEVADLVEGSGMWVAVGLPVEGLDGFRRSHHQAAEARQVALVGDGTRADGPTVVGYGDRGVALVAALARDLPSARAWVGHVLGPLAQSDDTAERLRATLRVYFEANGNQAEAAQRLVLHRNTVRYRLERIVELRGRGLEEDRADLEVALHACDLLGAAILAEAG